MNIRLSWTCCLLLVMLSMSFSSGQRQPRAWFKNIFKNNPFNRHSAQQRRQQQHLQPVQQTDHLMRREGSLHHSFQHQRPDQHHQDQHQQQLNQYNQQHFNLHNSQQQQLNGYHPQQSGYNNPQFNTRNQRFEGHNQHFDNGRHNADNAKQHFQHGNQHFDSVNHRSVHNNQHQGNVQDRIQQGFRRPAKKGFMERVSSAIKVRGQSIADAFRSTFSGRLPSIPFLDQLQALNGDSIERQGIAGFINFLGPVGGVVGGVVAVTVAAAAAVAVASYAQDQLNSSGRDFGDDFWEMDHSVWLEKFDEFGD